MSEEKLDRIDRRLNELVTISGNLVVAVRGLNDKYENLSDKVESLSEKVDKNNEQIEATNKRIDKTNVILEDALSRIIDLQKGQNEIIEDKIAA